MDYSILSFLSMLAVLVVVVVDSRKLRTTSIQQPLVVVLEQDDPTPGEDNIEIGSSEGNQLFAKLILKEEKTAGPNHVLDLVRYFETQVNLGACAPASAVAVLNALDYKRPIDPTYSSYMGEGFPFWTQTAFVFEPCVKKNLQFHVYGETLQGFASVMKCFGLNVDARHGDGSKEFTDSMVSHLEANHFVIANFERSLIHEKTGGHFSPIAGVVDGRLLILDVARYKYPPVFVPISDVVDAMSKVDLQSGVSRGFVAVWKK